MACYLKPSFIGQRTGTLSSRAPQQKIFVSHLLRSLQSRMKAEMIDFKVGSFSDMATSTLSRSNENSSHHCSCLLPLLSNQFGSHLKEKTSALAIERAQECVHV